MLTEYYKTTYHFKTQMNTEVHKKYVTTNETVNVLFF